MLSPRSSILVFLCLLAASCGGDEFVAASVGSPDGSSGGSDSGVDVFAGKGGTAGSEAGVDASSGGTAGVSGQGGSSGNGGTAGEAGTSGKGGTAGTGGVGGTGGAGATGGSGGSSGGSGTGGTASCGANETCFPDVPQGWTPVGYVPSISGTCSGAKELYSGDDIQIAQSNFSCDCKCSMLSSSCSSTLYYYTDTGCQAPAMLPSQAIASTCSVYAIPSNASHIRILSTAPTNTCTASAPKTPAVISSAFECSALPNNVKKPCQDNGVCVANIAPAKVCLLREGTSDCPTTAYTPFLYYRGFDDKRQCLGSCSCMPQCTCGGTSCLLQFHGDSVCDGTPAMGILADTCSGAPTLGEKPSAEWAQAAPAPSCKKSDTWKEDGEVVGANPVTICCPP